MNDMHVRWVSPKAVNLGVDMLPISITDSNFGLLVFTWLLPGQLDMNRLGQALSRTLSYYPQFAGRLVGGGDWQAKLAAGSLISSYILLGKYAIPVTTAHSDLVPNDDLLRDFRPEIVDPVICDVHLAPSAEDPLLRLKVVRFTKTDETSITFAFCHVLGDGLTFFRFTHMVSQFYCGLEAIHPLPSYEAYFQPVPIVDAANLDDVLRSHAPHLLRHYSQEEYMAMGMYSFTRTARLDINFSLNDLKHLQAEAVRFAGCKVSRHDALAAYLVTALNRIRDPPIQQIINLVNVRAVGQTSFDYTLPSPSFAGSALLHTYSDVIPLSEATSLGKVARRVGETVRQVKNPEFVRKVVAATAESVRRIFGAKRQAWWGAGENSVVINNCYRLDASTVDFGFDNGVRFFVNGSAERYIRIWAGNPTRSPDGRWASNEGSADISFRIEHELKQPFLDLVAEDRRKWSATEAQHERALPQARL